MSGDVEMVPAHSPSPDVSALVAAASRPVLEVPPESIAAALRALGEMAFGESDDDDRDDVRRRVELALSTRFDSLLDTMLSMGGSMRGLGSESERVVLQATRAADVVARLARESGFRVLARSRAAASSLRAAFAMAAFAASAADEANEPVNARTTNDSRYDSLI